MTTYAARSDAGEDFSHDLLLHDSDAELVSGTRAFVQHGLASGGQVLIHSTEEQVALLHDELGSHPRLTYGLDRDLYESPTATLFRYQRALEESPEPIELWATGTVPLGEDRESQAAWARYESLVNEALRPYAFHGLCTYDTQTLPSHVIAAAKATHPHVGPASQRRPSPDYQDPATFLTDPTAATPRPPSTEPTMSADLHGVHDLDRARRELRRSIAPGIVPSAVAADLGTATSEILSNGLQHGAPPVRLELWVAPSRLTCRVTDHGGGIGDRLSGYRYAQLFGHMGLWTARQLCGEIVISSLPDGRCSVVLTTA